MITKRSSHMPTFTISEMMKSAGTLVRTALEPQRLRNHDVAEDQRPVGRRVRAEHAVQRHEPSYWSALYHAMNASVR